MYVNLTLETAAQLLELEIPASLDSLRKTKLSMATSYRSRRASRIPGSLHFAGTGEMTPKQVDLMRRRGVLAVVASEPQYDSSGTYFPTLISPAPFLNYERLMALIRANHTDLKVVAITGSNGKSTTKNMLASIASKHFNTFWDSANNNSTGLIGDNIQDLLPSHELYIEETGAGTDGTLLLGDRQGPIHTAAKMVAPDVAIVLNVSLAHSGNYSRGSEGVLADKLALQNDLPPGGALIVNFDDPVLRVQDYRMQPTTFGIGNRSYNYSAEDVNVEPGKIFFTVKERDSREETAVVLHMVGEHNVYNALAAFAAARWLGLERSKIAAGLARYKPSGVRQNLTTLGGHTVLVDTFDATELSVLSSAEVLATLEVPTGGRRIYVLGDVPWLGENSEKVHRSLGKRLGDMKGIDAYYGYGTEIPFLFDELQEKGIEALHFPTQAELNSALKLDLKPSDVLALKGGGVSILGRTVDFLFGTDFYYETRKLARVQHEVVGNLRVRIVDGYGGIVTGPAPDASEDLSPAIGGYVSDVPILMVGLRAFANSALEEVRIGTPVQSIARRAFLGSERLLRVELPPSLLAINQGAFQRCTALREVELPEGLQTIGSRAFAECRALEQLRIPDSVRTVGPGAFRGCESVIVSYSEDSPVAKVLERQLSRRHRRTTTGLGEPGDLTKPTLDQQP